MNKWQAILCGALLGTSGIAAAANDPPNSPQRPANVPRSTPPDTTTPTDTRDTTTMNPTDPNSTNPNRTQTPPPASMGWPAFEKADTNNDGVVTTEELDAVNSTRSSNPMVALAQIDSNGDGRISREEWDAYKSGRVDRNRR